MAAACATASPTPAPFLPTRRSISAYRTTSISCRRANRPRCASTSSTCSTPFTRSGTAPALACSLRNMDHAAASISASRRSCNGSERRCSTRKCFRTSSGGILKLSREIPVRPNRAGGIVECALDQFRNKQAVVIDGARHGGAALRNGLEADPAVIRLIADQKHLTMALCLRVRKRPVQQCAADTSAAKRRLARQRSEQQRLGIADTDRQLPKRTHQQGPDPGGKG